MNERYKAWIRRVVLTVFGIVLVTIGFRHWQQFNTKEMLGLLYVIQWMAYVFMILFSEMGIIEKWDAGEKQKKNQLK